MNAVFQLSPEAKALRSKKRRGWDMREAIGLDTSQDCADSIFSFRTVAELRTWRRELLDAGETLGFVPTMGALHAGHLQLIRKAAEENDHVIVSIYVNPTQFGVSEDLGAYPRTLDSDMEQLRQLNKELQAGLVTGKVSAVFVPTTTEIYPTLPPTSEIHGKGSFVTITPVGELLEGASRPVFFRGVATVCMKLFNIVRPEKVYFGQKDVQQTVLIKRMVKDFHLDLEVCIVPTQREDDGLAMSSRNVFLGERRRLVAPILYQALTLSLDYIKSKAQSGNASREGTLNAARAFVDEQLQKQMALERTERALFELDYISIASLDSMEEVTEAGFNVILSGALKMLPIEELRNGEDGGENDGVSRPVRLIDNIVINADGSHT